MMVTVGTKTVWRLIIKGIAMMHSAQNLNNIFAKWKQSMYHILLKNDKMPTVFILVFISTIINTFFSAFSVLLGVKSSCSVEVIMN